MSDEPKRKPLGNGSWFTVGEPITDPVELAKLRARQTPEDGGAERMAGAALEVAQDREARGKPVNLLGAVLALAGLLPPEQKAELLRRLSSAEAPATP